MKPRCVYLLTSPGGKMYVGQSKRFERRMIEHAAMAKLKPTQTKLTREITQYGFDAFDKLVVVTTDSPATCALLERFWIGVISPEDLSLNEMLGSQGWSSDEVAKKISAAKKGKPAPPRGPITEEQRRRLSESHKGYRMPESQRQKIAEALRGRVRTEEHKRNIGLSQRGKYVSPETREKQRQAKLGRKLSAEHRAKLSAARTGKPHPVNEEARQRLIARNKNMIHTPEIREKMRAASTGRNLSDEAKEKCRQAASKYWADLKAQGATA